ncbi:MAG: VOC family protein [Acidimicrobiia bacterium]
MDLDALEVGDDPAAWEAAGFSLVGDEVVIGAVRVRCLGDGEGHDRWRLRGDDVPAHVDGIATTATTAAPATPVEHPNGITRFDHVVLRSPDLERTTEALAGIGLDLRRVRDVGAGEGAFQQRFFRLGDVILELVGPPRPRGDGPCTIWGYALVSEDIDATAAALGERCSAPKEAVQPGRRIATLRTRDLGIGPTIAVMTPHVRRGG